jgi:hypothetical protein
VDGKKTFISTDGLFATGSYGSGNALSLSGSGTRMIWYPKKAAFRAGYVDGTQWDDANIGDFSVAMGYNTISSGYTSFASGQNSVASNYHSIAMGNAAVASGSNGSASIGNRTTASGYASIAMGNATKASGFASTALGEATTASSDYTTAMGSNTTASGFASTAMGRTTTASGSMSTSMGVLTTAESFAETVIGMNNTDYTPLGITSFVSTDRLFVIGNGEFGGPLRDALVMLKNGNTTIGGSLAVNGNGTGTSYTLPTIRGTANYVLTTDGAGATSWAAASGGGSGVDLTTNQSVGGLKTFTSNDGLLATGTIGAGTASTLGAGVRMMWYPKKAAFRAGIVEGSQWVDANIGDASSAMGYSTTASGTISTAMGYFTTASGSISTAMGFYAIASGFASTAMGNVTTASGEAATAMGTSTTASGNASTAIGVQTNAKSYGETVIGMYNTVNPSPDPSSYVALDRLFVIGNGQSGTTLSNALVMLKNGNTTFSGAVTGASFTPSSDRRLKRNIVPLKNSMDAVMQLNPVSYEKKNSLTSTDYNIIENGFIAQELQKVMPTLVVEGTDKDKLLSVNYTAIIPVLTKAIQEQQKEIAELKKMLELLMKK